MLLLRRNKLLINIRKCSSCKIKCTNVDGKLKFETSQKSSPSPSSQEEKIRKHCNPENKEEKLSSSSQEEKLWKPCSPEKKEERRKKRLEKIQKPR